ncbi:MAG: molybdopterin-dependent oxidoreductase [Candidatus Thermoplasmatota archaeon]|nr:molybdopterin-dependent oxidoreductase [Candidatus Thermoplasmatota archaeon]
MKVIIDEAEVPFEPGQTILEAARNAEIYIPTLCAHKELPAFGACRLCVVKVDGMRGFPPACSTPATDGMVVHNKDKEVRDLRRNILRLILIEHPHSCIVCEERADCEAVRGGPVKAGRITGCSMCPNREICEIREVCHYLGIPDMEIPMEYKNLPVERYDPFFDRDYNLCILCGRCVRMCQQIRGVGAIAFTKRSHNTKVGTIFGRTHLEGACRFCGACIDVCPTGALSPKGSKWHGKADRSIESICTFCSLNCAMVLEEKWGRVMAAIPDRSKSYSRAYACVYGRFCIPAFLNGSDRLHYPLVRKKGRLTPVSWEEAFRFIGDSLKRFAPEEIGFLASPYMTNESTYLMNKLARDVVGTRNIDILSRFGRVVMQYLADRERASSAWTTLEDVEQADWIMLIQNDMVFTHPGIPVAIHKARERGAQIIILDDSQNEMEGESDLNLRIEPGSLRTFLAALTKLLLNNMKVTEFEEFVSFVDFRRSLDSLKMIEAIRLTGVMEKEFSRILEIMRSSKRGVLLVGSRIMEDPVPNQILGEINNILTILGMDRGFIPLLEEGNVRGVADSGGLFGHRPGYKRDRTQGKDYLRMVTGIRRGDIQAIILNESSVPPEQLRGTKFMVLSEIYPSELDSMADVILPVAAFSEEMGHFTSFDGRLWKLNKAVDAPGMSLQDWEIFSGIAKSIGSEEFVYSSSDDIWKEMFDNIPIFQEGNRPPVPQRLELLPVSEPSSLHLSEFTPYVVRYRGTPIHELVDDLRVYLEENDRIPKEDSDDEPKDKVPGSGEVV